MKRPLALTLWRSFSRGRLEKHTWRSFVDTFVADPEVVRNKKQVAGFSLAAFDGNRRALPRVESVHGLVLDLDHGNPTFDAVKEIFKKTLGVVYTTWSHEPNASRLRVAFPHERPVTASEHDRIWLWAADRCAKAGLELDPRARDASHLFFLPSHRPGAEYKHVELRGEPIDVDRVLRETKDLTPLRAVSGQVGPLAGNSTGGGVGLRDQSASGRDFRFCLERLREGDTDDELADALRDFSKKARDRDDYVERTIERAREVHDTRAPVMRVTKASLHCLPARFAHVERRHVELDLISDDGEIACAQIVVPSPFYSSAAKLWAACFPDIPAESLLVDWNEVASAWNRIRWKGRLFEVAVRDEAVRWMRAALRKC